MEGEQEHYQRRRATYYRTKIVSTLVFSWAGRTFLGERFTFHDDGCFWATLMHVLYPGIMRSLGYVNLGVDQFLRCQVLVAVRIIQSSCTTLIGTSLSLYPIFYLFSY